jgi:hypothetical protein
LFVPGQRKSAISDILDAEVFWNIAFDYGFFYFRAQIVQRDKRAEVSLGDFMLQAELGVGLGGRISP